VPFCPDCDRFLRAQNEANRRFAETGESLSRATSNACGKEAFATLWAACNQARKACATLRTELAEHVASHQKANV